MATQFTPAPWLLWNSGRYVEVVARNGHHQPVVKWTGFAGSGRSFDEQLGNARLIAAAPDYFDAAESLLGEGVTNETLNALQSAHAKASGDDA
jgi:hypothetical protein